MAAVPREIQDIKQYYEQLWGVQRLFFPSLLHSRLYKTDPSPFEIFKAADTIQFKFFVGFFNFFSLITTFSTSNQCNFFNEPNVKRWQELGIDNNSTLYQELEPRNDDVGVNKKKPNREEHIKDIDEALKKTKDPFLRGLLTTAKMVAIVRTDEVANTETSKEINSIASQPTPASITKNSVFAPPSSINRSAESVDAPQDTLNRTK